MYRFVLSPRWIGLGLLMTLAAVGMVGLGLWQLDRYHQRSEINTRIDDASHQSAAPLAEVLTPPEVNATGEVGPAPDAAVVWTRVTVTGRYDSANEILARARTLDGTVGFEVLTPLVLADGTAAIIDRGWLPPGPEGNSKQPDIPPAPAGDVTVVGRVHAPESRPTPLEPFDGTLAVRRIAPQVLADHVPYPLYGAYIALDIQTPPAAPAFVPIPPDHANATMNAGYVVQWWAFALLTLVGFGYLVRREARGPVHQDANGDQPTVRTPAAAPPPPAIPTTPAT